MGRRALWWLIVAAVAMVGLLGLVRELDGELEAEVAAVRREGATPPSAVPLLPKEGAHVSSFTLSPVTTEDVTVAGVAGKIDGDHNQNSSKEEVSATSPTSSRGSPLQQQQNFELPPVDAKTTSRLRIISPYSPLPPINHSTMSAKDIEEEVNFRDFKHSKRCPGFRVPSSKSADGKVAQEAIIKYSRYVSQYCNTTGMLQMHVGLEKFISFLDIIGDMVKLKRGDRIMDWGCGCGTMLNYYHLKYGTEGVGVDFTRAAIEHARVHSQPQQTFCWMDGTNLKHFQSNSFDAIVSWAVLYHIRRTLVQCDVVHQMVRLLKPGGIAYIGHLRTEKTQEYWKKKNKCQIPGAVMARYRDYRTFHMSAFKRNQFFSVVVQKMANYSDVLAASNVPLPVDPTARKEKV